MDPNNPFENPQKPGGPFPPNGNGPGWSDPNRGANELDGSGQKGYYNEQNPQFFQGPLQQGPQHQVAVPNGTTAMVLGIIGIVFSCGILGVVLNIIAIVVGSGAVKRGRQEPGKYTPSSLKQANAGRILGIIGLCIFALAMISLVVLIVAGELD